MLTIAEWDPDTETIRARYLDAHTASGDLVLPYRATADEIRRAANETWALPYDADDYVLLRDWLDASVSFLPM